MIWRPRHQIVGRVIQHAMKNRLNKIYGCKNVKMRVKKDNDKVNKIEIKNKYKQCFKIVKSQI